MPQKCLRPVQGVGAGLRIPHYREILTTLPNINWFEAITENYLGNRVLPMMHLLAIREHYPLVLHGVSLSIGSSDPIDMDYLRQLKQLIQIVEPAWVSDHLSWSRISGRYLPDLLPLPFTEEVIRHTVSRIQEVQDFLGCKMAFENISRYLDYGISEMDEAEFHREIAIRADCNLLLDINNIFVNSKHHGLDPKQYIKRMPKDRVTQYHVGGYTIENGVLLDTHGAKTSQPVWDLYGFAIDTIGLRPTCVEWDNHIPPLNVLMQEIALAESYCKVPQDA